MSGGSSHTPGRCLYECLNVARNASDADIKKAYRKAALIWHPDKNVGNEAAAKTAFQEITHAYAVLSDPQERQWYDDHREDILSGDHGGDGEGGGVSRVPDLWVYFRADAYSGFGDDENGFYAVYSRAFHEIFEAEELLREGEEVAPTLGSSATLYVDVAKFYSYWSHFATKHTFSWEDEYNPNEAPDRRTRRLIEKENARVRAAAKKKYQDEIRALVDFCKRRDRRVLQEKLRLRQVREGEAERRKTDAAAKAKEMAQRRALWLEEKARDEEAAAGADGDLAANGVVRLADLSSDDDGRRRGKGKGRGNRANGEGGAAARRKEQEDGDGEAEVEVYRCAVCRKDFKSDKQLSNHEGSKQHKKRLHEVEMQLLREARSASAAAREAEEQDDEDSDGASSSGSEESSGSGSGSQLDDYIDPVIAEIELGFASVDLEGSEGGSSDRRGGNGGSSDRGSKAGEPYSAAASSEAAGSESLRDSNVSGELPVEDAAEAPVPAAEGAKAEAGNGAGGGEGSINGSDSSSEDEDDSEEEDVPVLDVPAASSRARKNRVPAPAPQKPKAGKRRGKKKDKYIDGVPSVAAAAAGGSGKGGKQKTGRSAAKAGAAAAAAAAAAGTANVSALGCRICGSEFASRTKLFSHLSETGHARANA